MKIIFTILFTIFVFSTSYSQLTFHKIGQDTLQVQASTVNQYNSYAYFKNNGSTTINVRMERIIDQLPNAQWSSSICYGFCYASFVNVVPPQGDPAITLAPGQQDTMDVTMVCPTSGFAHIRMRVYNDANPSQNAELSFYISATQTNITNISTLADNYSLSQNYPNPFNPETKINFSIKENQFTTLKVYDALGNEVANLINNNLARGQYSVEFNAARFNLSSGVFYYKLTSGDFTEVKKMMLIK